MSALSTSESTDGVNLTTIHSSKGLEYKHVFIAGCEAAVLPHRKSANKEEERRLFYVALTRSKGAVDISFSKARAGKKQVPSPFLTEINIAGPQCVKWMGKLEEEPQTTTKNTSVNVNSNRTAPNKTGMPQVYYRPDGSKTLIKPKD